VKLLEQKDVDNYINSICYWWRCFHNRKKTRL